MGEVTQEGLTDERGWMDEAIARQPRISHIEVRGARLEVHSWGDRSRPGVLLVHGYAANAHWWSFIAPELAQDRHVVALSLSGMGQSDWRERYTLSICADELEAVAQAMGLFDHDRAPVIIAHSFGGFASVRLIARQDHPWGGLLLIDSRLVNDFHLDATRPEPKPLRVTPSRDRLAGRFRLLPPQDCRNERVFRHVAAHSVRRATDDAGEEGWTWASDQNLFIDFEGVPLTGLLDRIDCPMALLVGEQSYLVKTGLFEQIKACLPAEVPVALIPDAGHHVILDQPLAVIVAARLLLAQWQPDR
jgi:pimeloyl-ACP methyl ester carboxylesterase